MVLTAIINKNQLEGLLSGLHDDFEPVVQLGNILFFVVEWNNNGILEHDISIIPSGRAQNGNFGPNGSPLVTTGTWRELLANHGLRRKFYQ